MPTDWDAIEKAIETAAGATDDALASRISSVTRLTSDAVKRMFPTAADVQRLAKLMAIVKAATDQNTKVANLITNIESVGGTIITLLNAVA